MEERIFITKVNKLPYNIDTIHPIKPNLLNNIFEEIKEGSEKNGITLLFYDGMLWKSEEKIEEGPTLIIKRISDIDGFYKLIRDNSLDLGWDYPLLELDYLLEQVEDGDRENMSIMLLINSRLHEIM